MSFLVMASMLLLSLGGRTTSAFVARPFSTQSANRISWNAAVALRRMSAKKSDDDDEATVTILQRIIRLRGAVDKGYGRGGKKLGFPTANLPASLFQDALKDVPTGVYFGWAVVEDETGTIEGRNEEQRAVVNVGYSPTFEGEENKEKIVEAFLMMEEGEELDDFYGENMRLALSGFLRPEQKFPSFPDLIEAINNDVVNAKAALMMQPFAGLRLDPFIIEPCPNAEGEVWIGKDGGDAKASWEFQSMKDAIADATF
mmetsp:Transcript_21084/g.29768  ORF Transcript_21084/g.29768 Transcript_21084/m.29768 type:complete len:257 (-) Transcript_21084:41-811(-)